jgi:hypothetical protein
MSSIKKLKAALAAVPVGELCTPAAVEALYDAGHAILRQLSPSDKDPVDECGQQQLPGACMPVLVWLAAGLRSGLSPAATKQAHEMACSLLGVVSRVFPEAVLGKLATHGGPSPQDRITSQEAIKQLGTFGELQQPQKCILSTEYQYSTYHCFCLPEHEVTQQYLEPSMASAFRVLYG